MPTSQTRINIQTTVEELDRYVEHHSNPKDRCTLKLCNDHGELYIKALTKQEMGLLDRLANYFGLGGFGKEKIAAFMNSDAFGEALKRGRIPQWELTNLKDAVAFFAEDSEKQHHFTLKKIRQTVSHFLHKPAVKNPAFAKRQAIAQTAKDKQMLVAKELLTRLSAQAKVRFSEQTSISTLPKLAQSKLKQVFESDIDDGVTRFLVDIDEKGATKQVLGELEGRFQDYDELCYAKLKEKIGFYQKWQNHLALQMAHGLKDPGEVLGKGICYALSLRWAAEEFYPNKPFEPDSLRRDRFIQAFMKMTDEGVGSGQLERLRHTYKLSLAERVILIEKSKPRPNLRKEIEKLLHGDALKQHRGVAQLHFWWANNTRGHSITLVCKESPPTYLIHDPLRGTFALHSKEELTDCLTELIGAFHSKEPSEMTAHLFNSYEAAPRRK